MPKKQMYTSNAEKQKAYRKRKRKNKETPEELQQKRREEFREAYKELSKNEIQNSLTSLEYKVLIEWLEGATYSQLACIYEITKEAIRQKLVKSELKLKKCLALKNNLNLNTES